MKGKLKTIGPHIGFNFVTKGTEALTLQPCPTRERYDLTARMRRDRETLAAANWWLATVVVGGSFVAGLWGALKTVLW